MATRSANKNSIEAYKMSHQLKSDHWCKILFAMRLLNISCSSEAIARKSGMKEAQVFRRMSELLRDDLVYVSGKGLTSSGRPCALYSLTQHGKEKQEANAANQVRPTSESPEIKSFAQPTLF